MPEGRHSADVQKRRWVGHETQPWLSSSIVARSRFTNSSMPAGRGLEQPSSCSTEQTEVPRCAVQPADHQDRPDVNYEALMRNATGRQREWRWRSCAGSRCKLACRGHQRTSAHRKTSEPCPLRQRHRAAPEKLRVRPWRTFVDLLADTEGPAAGSIDHGRRASTSSAALERNRSAGDKTAYPGAAKFTFSTGIRTALARRCRRK